MCVPLTDDLDSILSASSSLCTHSAGGEAAHTQELVTQAVLLQEGWVLGREENNEQTNQFPTSRIQRSEKAFNFKNMTI